jgi:hypothetical protein
VKIRIIGVPEEVAVAAERIAGVLDLVQASAPLPSRGTPGEVRLYLEVRP